jgi:hypothetical protein
MHLAVFTLCPPIGDCSMLSSSEASNQMRNVSSGFIIFAIGLHSVDKLEDDMVDQLI